MPEWAMMLISVSKFIPIRPLAICQVQDAKALIEQNKFVPSLIWIQRWIGCSWLKLVSRPAMSDIISAIGVVALCFASFCRRVAGIGLVCVLVSSGSS